MVHINYKQKSMQAHVEQTYLIQTNHNLLISFLLVIKPFRVKTWTQSKNNHPVFILSRVRGSIDLNLWVEPAFGTKCFQT